mmetsp:Transcript_12368/g.18542  ORF Transcript_12368/g.18542 Transcript_12368/m.18542 type:complete len:148 (+) Transcript_12368:113-556(+)
MAIENIQQIMRRRSVPSTVNTHGYVRIDHSDRLDHDEDSRNIVDQFYSPGSTCASTCGTKALSVAHSYASEYNLPFQACLILSIAGFTILSIIGYLLANESIFIVTPKPKKKLGDCVFQAAAMYMVCMLCCGYVLVKRNYRRSSTLY